jgi:hypothetical protein
MNRRIPSKLIKLILLAAMAVAIAQGWSAGQLGHGTFGRVQSTASGFVTYPD